MTPVELSRTVLNAVRRAVDVGELSVAVPERAVVERPRAGGCGDYATGVALQLARPAGRSPMQVAEILRHRLLDAPGVAAIDITGPGFLNITLDVITDITDIADITLDGARGDQASALVRGILRSGRQYGHVGEYGYVPPQGEGPQAHEGHEGHEGPEAHVRLLPAPDLRAAVTADALARILCSQGVPVRVLPSGDTDRPAPGSYIPVRPAPAPSDPLVLGQDAARWALLHTAAHDRPRISRDHLVQRESNPLFRVRYAHARSRALVRNAADLGFAPEAGAAVLGTAITATTDSATATTTTATRDLLALLADHPTVLAIAARRRAPDRLARHLVVVADAFFAYHDATRVLPRGDEKPSAAHRARLALAEAAGTVLAGGLSLLGIAAPERL